MALQPSNRPTGSVQVLRFSGNIAAGNALATFPKTNGTFTTGGAAGDARGARFLFADATNLPDTARQFPADVYDDSLPAGEAPHTPTATGLTTLVVNAGELDLAARTWAQNTHITVKSLSANLGSVDTENAFIVEDTLTSGLGLGTGLPVLILPVALTGVEAATFTVDMLIEIRWSAHR